MKKYYLYEIDMKSVNIIGIILIIVLLVITPIIDINYNPANINIMMFIIFSIFYFVLHEIIHGIAYVMGGADFKNITFGIHLEKGILCCSCKQNVTKKNILFSLLAPFFLIGVVTYILGIILSNSLLVLLSIMNLAGSAGDLVMFYSLSRLKNFEFSEYDNPIAFALYTKEDLSTKKLFGLNYIGNTNKLEKTKSDKLVISKISKIVLIGIVILFIFYLVKHYLF